MLKILIFLFAGTAFPPQQIPFEIYVDNYKCVNPVCPNCVIDSDINYELSTYKLTTKTEFIFKGGFE